MASGFPCRAKRSMAGPPGIQSKHLSAFVKGLPCRIISGRAQEFAVPAGFLIIKMGMSSRYNQDHAG